MDQLLDWGTQLAQLALDSVSKFIEFLPQILGVLVILLIGWILARVSKVLVLRLIGMLNRIRLRIKFAGTPVLPNINEPVAVVVSRIIYWAIILVFIALSTQLLGLGMFADWLGRLVSHLPNILSGVLIIWAGVVFSGLIGQAISSAAVNLPESQRAALSRVAQLFVLILLILIGVDQIGVNVRVVLTIMAVTIGAALGGLAIAFSLGARQLVSNLIGVRYLNSDYRIGQRIRIGQHEGTILQITSVSVILDTEEGRVTIPAQMFSDQPSVLVSREPGNV